MVTILNQIYEEDFLGFSYGFRPGRSQHQALDGLSYALLKKKVNYVLDADIRGFFDNLDKRWLIKFVEHRVADPRILRLIQKWLKAGVMEEGKWSDTKTGSPQGSVVSPLLANIYLHYAFDLWVNVWREKWAHGEVGGPPLRGRYHLGIPTPSGRGSFLGELTGTTGNVRTGITSG
jgi:retron-type reverse transcriptase